MSTSPFYFSVNKGMYTGKNRYIRSANFVPLIIEIFWIYCEIWYRKFSNFFSWSDEESCKCKSFENTVCSSDEITTTTGPITKTAAAAEQQSMIQSSTTLKTTEMSSTTSSTTKSTSAIFTTTKSTTRKLSTRTFSTTAMATKTPALAPTDSRLLFI